MKKLYDNKRVTLAIICIVAYVVLMSVADSLSEQIGIVKIVTAPLTLIIAVLLLCWTAKNKLLSELGLDGRKIGLKPYLWFIPLIIVSSTNLWNGVTLNYSIPETLLYVLSMICIGFLEEFIFRGLLFSGMAKSGIKSVIIVSSLTFGIGHIVNLLNGAAIVETLCQIVYAVAIGFMFTVIFYKSKNLLPCIISHAVINSLSCFGREISDAFLIAVSIVMTVISVGYGLWLLKKAPQAE